MLINSQSYSVPNAANGDNKFGIAPGGCWLPKEGYEGGVPQPPVTIPRPVPTPPAFPEVVSKTIGLVNNADAQRAAQKHGMQWVNVMWEDTHRFDNSAGGMNITDMTLAPQVETPDSGRSDGGATWIGGGGRSGNLLPVMRHPNFGDKTADIKLDNFFILVGNEKGGDLQRVSLREYLGDIRKYLTDPSSFAGDTKSLLKEGESHVLASAQACFLPVPQGEGETVKFNPVVYNYQSVKDDPAVLTILCTPEGTSATIIDNQRDRFGDHNWGQPLFFNEKGERSSLVGGRISERPAELGGATGAAAEGKAEAGENMVMVIQVPLKQKNPQNFGFLGGGPMAMAASFGLESTSRGLDTEDAYITHGEAEGKFTEIDGQSLVRDETLPIRVTVQFYKATNGNVSEKDIDQAAGLINKVYEDGDFVGSLVTARDTNRPTAPQGHNLEPKGFWDDWAKKHEKETGETPADVARRFEELGAETGVKPEPKPEPRPPLPDGKIGW